jgi:hypothetical protein
MTRAELLCVMASNIAGGLAANPYEHKDEDPIATKALRIAMQIQYKVEKNNVNARRGE